MRQLQRCNRLACFTGPSEYDLLIGRALQSERAARESIIYLRRYCLSRLRLRRCRSQ